MKKYIIINYGEPRLIIFDYNIKHSDIGQHFSIVSAGSFIHHDKGLVVMHGSTSLNIRKDDNRGIVDEGLLRDFFKI